MCEDDHRRCRPTGLLGAERRAAAAATPWWAAAVHSARMPFSPPPSPPRLNRQLSRSCWGSSAAAACLGAASGEYSWRSMSLSTLPNAKRDLVQRSAPPPLRGTTSRPPPPARAVTLPEVEGSHPVILHGARSGHVSWTESVATLPGARPCVAPFPRSRRQTDPLEPVYALPRAVHLPIVEPAFKRDHMMVVMDIAGAQPRQRRVLKTREVAPLPSSETTRRRLAPRTSAQIISSTQARGWGITHPPPHVSLP